MSFVVLPQKVDLKNSKIETLKILKKCRLPCLEAKVVTPLAFQEYYQNKKLTPQLQESLVKTLEYFLKKEKAISIRALTEKEVDLLPRSESLKSITECLRHIIKTWDFFIKNFPYPEDLGIALLSHNFIPSYAAGTLDSQLPKDKELIMIEATYGIWEGIQSCLHDVYLVDKESLAIIRKKVPEKDFGLFLTAANWQYKKVPAFLKKHQVVSDVQIKELARQTLAVEKYFGPARIEFIIKKTNQQDDKKAVLVWHIRKLPRKAGIFDFKATSLSQDFSGEVIYTGLPIKIKEITDIKKLKKYSCPRLIIYLGEEIIRKRDLFLIQQIAKIAKEKDWPILYKGGQLTHVCLILREYGVQVFPVNQRIIPKGKIRVVKTVYN